MQSDGNSFSGDVVLDDFNMLYSDEDSKLDQIYFLKTNISGLLFWRFEILWVIEENEYSKKYTTEQQRTHKLGFSATVVLLCIFVWCYKELKSS